MSNTHVIGLYDTLEEAQAKLDQLHHSQIPLDRVSIVSPDDPEHQMIVGISANNEAMASGCVAGALWGAGIGMIVSFLINAGMGNHQAETFLMDFFGALLLGLTLGSVTGLTLGGLAATAAARKHLMHREEPLVRDKFLLAVQDTPADIEDKARNVLSALPEVSSSMHEDHTAQESKEHADNLGRDHQRAS